MTPLGARIILMSREMLATDIDEVLFPFVEEFSKWHNEEYGTVFTVDDFHTYEFEQVLKEPVPEVVHRLRLFLHQDQGHVEPVQGSQDSIARIGEAHDLAAITARHPELENPTRAYLLRYFRDNLASLTLVGHKETVKIVRTKAEVCQEIGAIALVDDSISHVKGCAEAGIQGVLFGEYPWNKCEVLPSGVVRCKDWRQVEEVLGV